MGDIVSLGISDVDITSKTSDLTEAIITPKGRKYRATFTDNYENNVNVLVTRKVLFQKTKAAVAEGVNFLKHRLTRPFIQPLGELVQNCFGGNASKCRCKVSIMALKKV